jgi:uncharacterized membrane protein YcaP (DUF421 family)
MPNLEDLVRDALGCDTAASELSLEQIACRAAVIYLAGLALVRIGKSRLLARSSAIDVLVGFMLGAVLARGIVGSTTLSAALVASAVLIGLHWFGSWLGCRSHRLGDLIKGRVRLLARNGKVDWTQMRKSHLSIHDLEEAMRLRANVDELERIEAAYKERSGQISVVIDRGGARSGVG